MPPALILGLPNATPSASKNASLMPVQRGLGELVGLAVVGGDAVGDRGRAAAEVVGDLRRAARPAARSSWPLADVPVTTCLFFGSQARTLTVFGCCTPVMRGRKEIIVSWYVRLTVGSAPPLLAGRNSSFGVVDDDLVVVHQREPPRRSPSRSRCSAGRTRGRRWWTSTLGGSPDSPAIFVIMSEAETCWNVRVLRCRLSLCALS